MRASMRWTSQHGSKVIHRTWIGATIHRIRITLKFKKSRRSFAVYRCRWGQWYRDGEVAPVHWHVGSTRNRPRKEE